MSEKVNVTELKREEEKWYEVNPLTIDQNLFQKKREDPTEEKVRKLILETFKEAKKNPKKYFKKFRTFSPKKTWTLKSIKELREYGDIATWVHFFFECAQKIHNGAEWENVVKDNNVIVIEGNGGYLIRIGGEYGYSLFNFIDCVYGSLTLLKDVPLIVQQID